jgi:hypothetical protein
MGKFNLKNVRIKLLAHFKGFKMMYYSTNFIVIIHGDQPLKCGVLSCAGVWSKAARRPVFVDYNTVYVVLHLHIPYSSLVYMYFK